MVESTCSCIRAWASAVSRHSAGRAPRRSAVQANLRLADLGRTVDIDPETAVRMVGAACAAALGVWSEQEETDSEQRSREIMSVLASWWQGR